MNARMLSIVQLVIVGQQQQQEDQSDHPFTSPCFSIHILVLSFHMWLLRHLPACAWTIPEEEEEEEGKRLEPQAQESHQTGSADAPTAASS